MSQFDTEENPSPKQALVIRKMLECGSLVEVARKTRVSRATINRWMKDPDFRGALRRAHLGLLDEVVRRLSQICGRAVGFLEETLDNGDATISERLRATQLVLDSTLKIHEQVTLSERVEALEERLGHDD